MSTNNETKYNDQHTLGLGYLNRARTVNPTQGQPYESVSLTGLGGKVESPTYTYYDCTSVIGKALPKYLLLKDAINDDKKKVIIRFKVSDVRPDSYLAKDKKSGQEVRRHIIKGKLLDITWASIDGQEVKFELDNDDDEDQPKMDAPNSDGIDQSDNNEASQQSNATPVDEDQSKSFFSDDELSESVKLDRDDPDFIGKKDELKSLGYRWDSNNSAWFRPAV